MAFMLIYSLFNTSIPNGLITLNPRFAPGLDLCWYHEMKLSFHQTELKVFIRCINSLGKLGQEIYFDWTSDGLVLKTVNSSRSAYAAVTFKHNFFVKVTDIESSSSLRFKIPSRSCSNVFKLSSTLERTVQKCRILLTSNATVLVVQFFCKYGIVKTFNMSIIECEHLEAVCSPEQSANHLVLSTKVLCEVLQNFRQSSEEITVVLRDGECNFQNYVLHGDPTGISTQLPLSATEFDSYLVTFPCDLTFCQKELRALLGFCDLISPALRIYCDRPGRPVVFACTHETRLSARFVLATLPPDAYSVSNSQSSQQTRPRALASKPTVQMTRQLADQSNTFNISTVSDTTRTKFSGDPPKDEVTLLATLSTAPMVGHRNLDEMQNSLANPNPFDLTHTQLLPPTSSPLPQNHVPRPYSVPRLRQSV
ncbi:unnamed protein product, partial [Dicrocoelium dendriticum]